MSIEKDVRTALQYAFAKGWITRRDGNISVRVGDSFYITPSSVDKTGHFTMVKGSVSPEGSVFLQENTTPSIETDMHVLAHQSRLKMEQCAVVHIHPTETIAAMRRGIDLHRIAAEFPELRRYTKIGPLVGYYEPGSTDLAVAVGTSLSSSDICGMLNHGVTAVGKTINEAIEHIERLNHICEIVLMSRRADD